MSDAHLGLSSVVSNSSGPHGLGHQAPLSMEFSRHEYWSGLPFPSPKDLPDPEIEPSSPALQANSLPTESVGNPLNMQYPRTNLGTDFLASALI